jgi:hypothetical protein
MNDQTQAQETAGRYPNRYRPGQSGNLAGRPSAAQRRARVLAEAHRLAQPLGRDFESLDSITQTLLLRCADLLLRKPRRYDECVRRDNLVSRILRDVLRRHGPVWGNSTSPLRERLAVGPGA